MTAAESVCAALLLAYLVWVPLPFGSNVDAAYVPLIVPPLVICVFAALLRSAGAETLHLSRAYRIWSVGGLAFLAIVALQLIPLPPAIAAVVSPESHAIWAAADRVAALSRDAVAVPRVHPITINAQATRHELFRLIALFATFQSAALLIYTKGRRVAFAAALSVAAVFEALYGIREAALRRYAIWGWVNRLIFDRVTGTYVNPNHFAHYAGIVLPFSIFLGAIAWRNAAAGHKLSFGRHVAALIERQFLLFSASVGASLSCIAAILLAQSRGALVAIVAGIASMVGLVTAATPLPDSSRRHHSQRIVRRTALGVAALGLAVAGLVALLGTQRTITRFQAREIEQGSFGGRRVGIEAALRVWRAFPLFGAGAGAFADVASIGQSEDVGKWYQHAHDDYAEIAATTGALGVIAGLGAFVAGLLVALRHYLVPESAMSWRGRAFAIAALTSVLIAAVHALIDFNFFIPANAATIAAIAGAAVASPVRVRPPLYEADVPAPAE